MVDKYWTRVGLSAGMVFGDFVRRVLPREYSDWLGKKFSVFHREGGYDNYAPLNYVVRSRRSGGAVQAVFGLLKRLNPSGFRNAVEATQEHCDLGHLLARQKQGDASALNALSQESQRHAKELAHYQELLQEAHGQLVDYQKRWEEEGNRRREFEEQVEEDRKTIKHWKASVNHLRQTRLKDFISSVGLLVPNIALGVTDYEGAIAYVSKPLTAMLGVSADKLVGKRVLDLVNDGGDPKYRDAVRRFFNTPEDRDAPLLLKIEGNNVGKYRFKKISHFSGDEQVIPDSERVVKLNYANVFYVEEIRWAHFRTKARDLEMEKRIQQIRDGLSEAFGRLKRKGIEPA